MGVANCCSQSIRGVPGGAGGGATEQDRDHPSHLQLLGIPMSRHSELDFPRRILEDWEACSDCWKQCRRPSLSQLQHALHIPMVKGVFDGNFVGRQPLYDDDECIMNFRQSEEKSVVPGRADDAKFQITNPAGFFFYDAIAGRERSGINPENAQRVSFYQEAWRSNSSSAISKLA